MTPSDNRAQALDWVIRTNDPDFDDWDAFTTWLEHDPANADSYHGLLASEAEVRPYLEPAPAAPIVEPADVADVPTRKTERAAFWFIPAAAAAALGVLLVPRLTTEHYATRPGELRVIALGGGDQIVMNGGTRMQLAGINRRSVRLQEGHILLRLREPQGGRIEVESGDLNLVDVGTVFEVRRTGTTTEVGVSEGAVVADPGGASLRLDAGEALEASDGATMLRSLPADLQSIGSFERGQLVYRDSSLSRVLRDLERTTGLDFSEAATISASRFTGTLSVAEVKRDPRSLEPLLGIKMKRVGQTWYLNKGTE
jgi:transmembrane sensor